MDADEKQRILILNPDFVTLRTDLLEQEKITPRSKVMALLAKFAVLIFLNITLGGGAFRSPWGIQCGSVAFWVVHVIMVAFLISSAWAAQVSGVDTKFNLIFWLALNISLLPCYRRIYLIGTKSKKLFALIMFMVILNGNPAMPRSTRYSSFSPVCVLVCLVLAVV
jgi:hypothetical protein